MHGQVGRLVPVGDASALAVAMAESLASTHDRDALKARAQDFSIDKAVDQYVELLLPDRNRPETRKGPGFSKPTSLSFLLFLFC